MKGLAPRQQQIWDLKQAGKTRDQIASELGISPNNVGKTITTIRKKLGETVTPREYSGKAIEKANPEKAAAVMDALSNPELAAKIKTFRDACEAAGLPLKVGEAMVRRLLVKFGQPIAAARDLKTTELIQMLNERIGMALTFMDEKVMSEASFRDLALGTTAMIEKRQLLRGEPTAIVSDHERKKIHELAPLLLGEMQRRGLTMEGQVTEKEVTPA